MIIIFITLSVFSGFTILYEYYNVRRISKIQLYAILAMLGYILSVDGVGNISVVRRKSLNITLSQTVRHQRGVSRPEIIHVLHNMGPIVGKALFQ